MGNIDSMPVVSQTKSLVQIIGGDTDGAEKTQEIFSKQGHGVSQLNSLGGAIAEDSEGAKEIQKEFDKDLFEMATPGVGWDGVEGVIRGEKV